MIEKNYLCHLKETQEIVDNCDGDSNSKLCSSCRATEYGFCKNYSSHPSHGMIFCEGAYCEEAAENVEYELIDEYNNRKEELKMDDAKMNIEIDLSTLEQNLVKMTTDKIESKIVDMVSDRIMEHVKSVTLAKVSQLVSERVNSITKNDIYNIKVKVDGNYVNLFDFMVGQLINKAKEQGIEFENKINELTNFISYKPVDGEFSEDEFKVLTVYTEGEYENTTGMEIKINGKGHLSLHEGEPEDMTLNRDLSDVLNIAELIEMAYLAGKNGKVMYTATEVKK